MNSCSSCHAPIIWAKTQKGKPMPLDAEPSEKGNIVLTDGVAVYLTKEALAHVPPAPGERRYVSHFATCVDAAKFRRPR